MVITFKIREVTIPQYLTFLYWVEKGFDVRINDTLSIINIKYKLRGQNNLIKKLYFEANEFNKRQDSYEHRINLIEGNIEIGRYESISNSNVSLSEQCSSDLMDIRSELRRLSYQENLLYIDKTQKLVKDRSGNLTFQVDCNSSVIEFYSLVKKLTSDFKQLFTRGIEVDMMNLEEKLDRLKQNNIFRKISSKCALYRKLIDFSDTPYIHNIHLLYIQYWSTTIDADAYAGRGYADSVLLFMLKLTSFNLDIRKAIFDEE